MMVQMVMLTLLMMLHLVLLAIKLGNIKTSIINTIKSTIRMIVNIWQTVAGPAYGPKAAENTRREKGLSKGRRQHAQRSNVLP